MNKFYFWQKWLFAISLFLIVLGILLAFFPHSGFTSFIFNARIDPVFWGNDSIPEKAYSYQAWIYGVLGSVILGWGILLAFIIYHPFKACKKWAWTCVAVGFAFWFIVDTGISALFGVIFNVLFNIFLLLLIGNMMM